MAKIVMVWELGGGLGHVMPLRQISNALQQTGSHQIYWIVKEPGVCRDAMPMDSAVRVLQAPRLHESVGLVRGKATAFFHIFRQKGFAEKTALSAALVAWRELYETIQPDLLVFDHSPTALLAARGLAARQVLVGTGFTCPPPQSPFGVFRPHLLGNSELRLLIQEEEALRVAINQTLIGLHIPPLIRLADLYAEVDACFLLTLAELDHLGVRPRTPYFGLPSETGGCRPKWSTGDGKRVFAYLKPFPHLPQLLTVLEASKTRCLIYLNTPREPNIADLASDRLLFTNRPVDLAYAAEQCDVFVGHATHAATGRFFLQGVPSLMIPLQQEQLLFAEQAARLGLGVLAEATAPKKFATALQDVFGKQYTDAAKRFAGRYQRFDTRGAFMEMIAAMKRLLPENDHF